MALAGGCSAVDECGVSANSKLNCGSSLLWLAAKGGHTTLVKFLLEEGADLSANGPGPPGAAKRHWRFPQ